MLGIGNRFIGQEPASAKEFRWYIARTQARKEEVARANLANQGVVAFVPHMLETRRSERSFKEHSSPIFPSYIFFRAPSDLSLWRSVGGTRGISYVIGAKQGSPTPVPHTVMKHILQLCPGSGRGSLQSSLQVGDAVAVTRGPLTGLSAHIHALDSRGRVELLLDIMGGAKTMVDLRDVARR